MKKKLGTILGFSFAIILIVSVAVFPSYASPEPTIYLEPTNCIFDAATVSIGYKFNVTVWVNNTAYPYNLMMSQVYIIYNATMINVTDCTTRTWPNPTTTPSPESWDTEYIFYGKGGVPASAYFPEPPDNGAIKIGETLIMQTAISGPKKLACFEFTILTLPSEGETLSCTLGIDNTKTFLYSQTGKIPDVDKSDGFFQIIPEFSPFLMLLTFMAITIIAIALTKKDIRKSKVHMEQPSN